MVNVLGKVYERNGRLFKGESEEKTAATICLLKEVEQRTNKNGLKGSENDRKRRKTKPTTNDRLPLPPTVGAGQQRSKGGQRSTGDSRSRPTITSSLEFSNT
ncbi:hypothetical protein M9H77_03787 [Catharanthus roseus]|uniref:Uncharacterized protein n=1 Tax=Catharanthus roseus TaxID=4058 RepID=A0ACC0CCP3_CATRO|nr:hypothetical protein M9H77_03787 [Catharanthus roseus]